MESNRIERRLAALLCAAVAVAGVVEQLHSRLPYAEVFAPGWAPVAAGVIAALGITGVGGTRFVRIRRGLMWGGLLLLIWAANGLPLDLLRLTPLMPPGIDWPGTATRALALAATGVVARLALTRPTEPSATSTATWYGYAAFVLALPYPVMRTIWLFGGMTGLTQAGATGTGIEAWLACVPWLLAAALSLLLAARRPRLPRRLLLAAGWSAMAAVAMIGPAAFWLVASKLVMGADLGLKGIASWVPVLFYGSWLLWAIAAGAATRSYQLRSADETTPRPVGRRGRRADVPIASRPDRPAPRSYAVERRVLRLPSQGLASSRLR